MGPFLACRVFSKSWQIQWGCGRHPGRKNLPSWLDGPKSDQEWIGFQDCPQPSLRFPGVCPAFWRSWISLLPPPLVRLGPGSSAVALKASLVFGWLSASPGPSAACFLRVPPMLLSRRALLRSPDFTGAFWFGWLLGSPEHCRRVPGAAAGVRTLAACFLRVPPMLLSRLGAAEDSGLHWCLLVWLAAGILRTVADFLGLLPLVSWYAAAAVVGSRLRTTDFSSSSGSSV